MIYTKQDKLDHYKFMNVGEFMKVIEHGNDLLKLRAEPDHCTSRTQDDPSFCSFSFKEAMNLAVYGWPEGVKPLQNSLDLIEEIRGRKKSDTHDFVGEELDIGAFSKGDPECFVVKQKVGKPIYTIGVYSTFLAWVHQDEIMNRGAGIVACIDQLSEYADIELSCITAIDYYSKPFVIEIILDTKPIVLTDIAFFLANPAFLRRLVFAFMEMKFCQDSCGGYGRTMDYPSSLKPFDIYIPELTSSSQKNFSSPEKGYEEIKKHFETLMNQGGSL
jgi:hypothetical protein